jgi:hypothetical protein
MAPQQPPEVVPENAMGAAVVIKAAPSARQVNLVMFFMCLMISVVCRFPLKLSAPTSTFSPTYPSPGKVPQVFWPHQNKTCGRTMGRLLPLIPQVHYLKLKV